MNKTISSALIALLLSIPTAHANLINNGDFSNGNTAFSSAYRYTNGLDTSEGVYTVATNPQLMHPGATSFGDHTNGTGNMLVANGATSSDITVWEQMVSVSVNENYIFSGWAASWGHYGDNIDIRPARLQLYANGSSLGTEFTVEQQNGVWTEFQYNWNSGNSTSVTLRIIDANLAGAPNDFSLDDISLTRVSPVPEPDTTALFAFGLAGMYLARRRRA